MKMRNQRGYTLIELILCFAVVALIPWAVNIFKILKMSFDPITTELVLRFIGIPFFPLGAIMGFV